MSKIRVGQKQNSIQQGLEMGQMSEVSVVVDDNNEYLACHNQAEIDSKNGRENLRTYKRLCIRANK